ncbi:hypothetical protein CPB86DRAFT_822791 [Serendipita vermifera]|nr:hypothetical protein CPB86DRAFT_822791 [Serendipita vermifera]
METPPILQNLKKRTREFDEGCFIHDDDASVIGRPNKRPALGLSLPLNRPDLRNVWQEPPPEDGGSYSVNTNSAKYNDDWVNRTRGLRLDSPLLHSQRITATEREMNLQPISQQPNVQVFYHSSHLPTPKHSPTSAIHLDYFPTAKGQEVPGTQPAIQNVEQKAEVTSPIMEDTVMQSPESKPLPLEKKRIYMGYREDCESCRSHVPGHYIHFI